MSGAAGESSMVVFTRAFVGRSGKDRMSVMQGVLASALVLFWVFPLVLAVYASFRQPEILLAQPGEMWPPSFSLGAYHRLFSSGYWLWLVHSAEVAITSTGVALLVAVPLGYAAGFHGGRVAGVTIRMLLLTYLIPAVFVVFPILQFATMSGLRGSPVVVGILAGAFSAPICSWVLKSQFALVPRQLFEMAELDGFGVWARLLHVVIPATAYGVIAASCLAFIIGWGEYTYSVTLLPIASEFTVSVGIPHFVEGDIWSWDLLLPAICLAGIPPVGMGLLLTTLLDRQLRRREGED
jgi:ABC-type glycerol-3-phosphate transport system permease component